MAPNLKTRRGVRESMSINERQKAAGIKPKAPQTYQIGNQLMSREDYNTAKGQLGFSGGGQVTPQVTNVVQGERAKDKQAVEAYKLTQAQELGQFQAQAEKSKNLETQQIIGETLAAVQQPAEIPQPEQAPQGQPSQEQPQQVEQVPTLQQRIIKATPFLDSLRAQDELMNEATLKQQKIQNIALPLLAGGFGAAAAGLTMTKIAAATKGVVNLKNALTLGAIGGTVKLQASTASNVLSSSITAMGDTIAEFQGGDITYDEAQLRFAEIEQNIKSAKRTMSLMSKADVFNFLGLQDSIVKFEYSEPTITKLKNDLFLASQGINR
jgi:hypothetical protein